MHRTTALRGCTALSHWLAGLGGSVAGLDNRISGFLDRSRIRRDVDQGCGRLTLWSPIVITQAGRQFTAPFQPVQNLAICLVNSDILLGHRTSAAPAAVMAVLTAASQCTEPPQWDTSSCCRPPRHKTRPRLQNCPRVPSSKIKMDCGSRGSIGTTSSRN